MDLPSGYRLSLDPADLQFEVIHAYLTRSYWSPGIPREVVERAAQCSLVAGVYGPDGVQVGFARLATDHATFGYLADVFVLEAHRGKGLSTAMVRALMELPEVRGFRRLMLATRDAHGVYAKLGWEPVTDPTPFMQVLRKDVYGGAQ
ncbi:MAG TPA: GNAT family N-acetyltransferase [Holophagaceae bacterium]|nr:GNAT family N-acetyltransferase [Holophagaceae bacterium]